VDWQNNDEISSSLQFQGAGSTPLERCASMQRQLAALCTSTAFLAPESWPACSCLTSFTSDGLLYQEDVSFLRAATHTPSLAALNACIWTADACTALLGLSCLQHLTSLALSISDDSPPGALDDDVMAAIGQLSSLKQLQMNLELFDQVDSNEGAVVPASWSGLSCLTNVSLEHGYGSGVVRLAAAELSRLAAVEDLALEPIFRHHGRLVAVGGVASLFALTRLTSLAVPCEFAAPDGDGGGEEAGGSRGLEAPQQWRDGLQYLTWREHSRGSLAMLTQLTSLVFLRMADACISPQLCRCEPQCLLPP
jgi:hypothetical protein